MSAAHVIDLEKQLRSQLARCRLVFELGLDQDFFKQIVRALADLLRMSPQSVHELGRRYPALLVSYLVAEGVHSYRQGSYWPRLTIPCLRRLGHSLGMQFDGALTALRLPTFEDLVEEDKAKRWLSRILIHGGIPRYSLNDFFRLLLASLRGGPGQATDLVAMWRSRKTRFQGIDKPVERFLLHGGDVALDLLDRCLEMITEEARTGSVPSAEELGLPRYVVDAYLSMPVAERRPSRTRTAIPRPRVELDPWDPFGPRMLLPAVPVDMSGAEWHVSDSESLTRVPARANTAERVMLNPAFAWTASLWREYEQLQETTFEALEGMPLLLFDPGSARLLASRQVVRLDSVWAMHPREGVRLTSDREGRAPLRVREEFPDPAGRWHGYVRRHYELAGTSTIYVHQGQGDPWLIRVTHRQRPGLVASVLDGLATLEGHPVCSTPPSLDVPPVSEMSPADWRLTIRWVGGSLQRTLAELPREGEGPFDLGELFDSLPPSGIVKLTLHGPLGFDLREEFAFVEGLRVLRPSKPLLPSDGPAKVRLVLKPRHTDAPWGAEVEVPPETDEAVLAIPRHLTGELRLRVTVPRVLWSLDRTDNPRSSFGNQVLSTTLDEILGGVASALSVRTRLPGTWLALHIVDGDRVLQSSDPTQASGPEGRWTFELRPFADTLRTSTSPILSLMLTVDGRRQVVARVVARLAVSEISAIWVTREAGEADVLLTFAEERRLRKRVARLWPLDRPWEQPRIAQVPDDDASALLERVTIGRYLVEIAVDDEWSRPSRPPLGSANTAIVVIGGAEERESRVGRLDLGSPYAVLERAATDDRPLRPLTPEELEEAAPFAIDLLCLLLEEHGHRAVKMSAYARLTDLLLDVPDALLASLSRVESSQSLVLKAGICFLRPLKERHPQIKEEVLEELWSVCAPLAAVLDVPRVLHDAGAAARAEQNLGWPRGGDRSFPIVGGHVNLPFASMEREQIEEIRRSMNLIPTRWLDHDTLAAAYLDWLEVRCHKPSEIEVWCDKHVGLLDLWELSGRFREAVSRRRPPPQAPAEFVFPQVTLSASGHLLRGTARAHQAVAALVEAVPFSGKLITRDMLVACVLDFLDEDGGEA